MIKAPKIRAPSAVRHALIEAARQEFARQGYAGATTREIAQCARTSEVMLFRHFGSKANLFKEAVFFPFDQYMTEFIAREFNEDTPRELSRDAWQRFSGELFRLLDENRALLAALIVAFNYGHGDTMGVDQLTSLDTFFIHATDAMERNTTEDYRAAYPDPRIVMRLIFSLLASVALFKEWLFPESIASQEAVTAAMKHFVEGAIGIASLGIGGKID